MTIVANQAADNADTPDTIHRVTGIDEEIDQGTFQSSFVCPDSDVLRSILNTELYAGAAHVLEEIDILCDEPGDTDAAAFICTTGIGAHHACTFGQRRPGSRQSLPCGVVERMKRDQVKISHSDLEEVVYIVHQGSRARSDLRQFMQLRVVEQEAIFAEPVHRSGPSLSLQWAQDALPPISRPDNRCKFPQVGD
jgi:hypothetical protein